MSARSLFVKLCVCVVIAGLVAAGQPAVAGAPETPEAVLRQLPFSIYTAWPFDAKEAARRQ